MDVGTGSGCIATTLGLELPESTVLGLDVSDAGIGIANENKEKLSVGNVSFQELDFLNTIEGKMKRFSKINDKSTEIM